MTRRQSRAEATYPSTQALADLLTASTGGWLPEEAAIGLLAAHGYWLHRSGFRTACVTLAPADPEQGTPDSAWIAWEAVPAYLDGARASTSETAVLAIAASLARTDRPLHLSALGSTVVELTGHLGPHTLSLVLDALAHRAGWHETGRTHTVTGHQPTPTARARTTNGDVSAPARPQASRRARPQASCPPQDATPGADRDGGAR